MSRISVVFASIVVFVHCSLAALGAAGVVA